MAAKDSETKQWTDPKDYGLPFVEISPIQAKSILVEKEIIPPDPVQEVIQSVEPVALVTSDEETIPKPVELIQKAETPQEPDQALPKEAKKPSISIQTASTNKPKEENKSSAWNWAVVFIGVGIIAVIVWQLLAQMNPGATETKSTDTANSIVEKSSEPQSIAPESTVAEQNQSAVNQDSIANPTNSNPNISKPAESGTTIANIASGNLIRIDSKAERPQYFIIVGSLPNEKLAVQEASQYFGRTSEIYLISPYDGGSNYRLGLSRFGSFRTAAEELERVKSQYTEELWILKY
ncbi:hypothetical protein SAMN03080617_03037 [Algoriphagus alkaliphilus]|uniref:SPOR domain-containing protein n=1 Tax=Algoriphagus alkaliphilus TaxID=279824 RepID=A0A1G5YZU5_9BACT|nr:hypothetical protein SAMN03080617_03037 [Algoriphagus alkaliphilus]